jgi:hypothetical protein
MATDTARDWTSFTLAALSWARTSAKYLSGPTQIFNSQTHLAVALLSPVSITHRAINGSTGYKPPAIIVMDSPNPNINSERSVIQARTLFDTPFTSPSIGSVLLPCTPPVRSLGV